MIFSGKTPFLSKYPFSPLFCAAIFLTCASCANRPSKADRPAGEADAGITYERVAQVQKQPVGALAASLAPDRPTAERRLAVWGLGTKESKEGAKVLSALLLMDYKNRLFGTVEEKPLLDAVLALGLVAADDDEAFRFLTTHLTPTQWRESKKWTSTYGAYGDDLLTSLTVQAIGISGRSDGVAILAELRKRPAGFLHRFAGDVTQAEFYRYIRSRYGKDHLVRYLTRHDDELSEFVTWTEGEGGESYKWANDMMRGPRPAN